MAGGVVAIAVLVVFDVSPRRLVLFDLGAFVAGSLAARGIHIFLRSR